MAREARPYGKSSSQKRESASNSADVSIWWKSLGVLTICLLLMTSAFFIYESFLLLKSEHSPSKSGPPSEAPVNPNPPKPPPKNYGNYVGERLEVAENKLFKLGVPENDIKIEYMGVSKDYSNVKKLFVNKQNFSEGNEVGTVNSNIISVCGLSVDDNLEMMLHILGENEKKEGDSYSYQFDYNSLIFRTKAGSDKISEIEYTIVNTIN